MNTEEKLENLSISIDVIQSFPPNILNRNEMGLPKSATFGGTRRSRISSQSINKALCDRIINDTNNRYSNFLQAKKLDKWGTAIYEEIKDKFEESDHESLNAFCQCLIRDIFKNNIILLFFTKSEIELLCNEIEKQFINAKESDSDIANITKHYKDFEKKCEKAKLKGQKKESLKKCEDIETYSSKVNKIIVKHEDNSIDFRMLLLGRMIASIPGKRIDGKLYSSHVLSTHKSNTSSDFFTAMSDANCNHAAHTGYKCYNNGMTMYKYYAFQLNSFFNKDILSQVLDPDIIFQFIVDAIFIAICVTPRAGEHSFFSAGSPDYVCLRLKKSHPTTMVNAFERGIKPEEGGGFLKPSISALKNRIQNVQKIEDFEFVEFDLEETEGKLKDVIRDFIKPYYDKFKNQID